MLSRLLNSHWPTWFRPLALGQLCGLLSWAWATEFFLSWGASHETISAFAAAVGIAVTLSWLPGPRNAPKAAAWLWLIPAVAAVFAPSLVEFALARTALWGGLSLSDSRLVFVGALASALMAVAPGLWAILRLAGASGADARLRPSYWIGLATVWCLVPLLVGPWVSAQSLALLASVVCVGVFLRLSFRPRETVSTAETDVEVVASGLSWADILGSAVVAIAAGGLMVIVARLRSNLFLSVASLPFAEWSGAALGVALGIRCLGRAATPAQRTSRGLLILGLALAAEAACVSGLMHLALSISAGVSNLALILGLRTAIVAAMALPVGLACGAGMAACGRGARSSILPMQSIAWFTVGFVALSWTTIDVSQGGNVAMGLLAVAIVLQVVAAVGTEAGTTRRYIIPAATAGAAVLAAFLHPSIQNNRILFSGIHFQAYSGGLSAEMIPVLDGGRSLRTVRTPDATWSRWSHRGALWHLHENGVFRSAISVSPDTCPQSAPDVVNGVLPLALHRAPRRVLVLGAENPAVVSTCVSHPVESILITDRDPATLALCRDAVERVCLPRPEGDARLAWSAIDPVLAPTAAGGNYDIVLSTDTSIAEFADAARFTTAHYRRIAGCLSPGGIFCQRLTCFDFGTAPILRLARTMQAAFPNVELMEISPGECLLLGSADPILLDEEFVARIEKLHVRDLLGKSGWDWSIVMGLRAVRSDALRELADSSATNRVLSTQFAFAIPQDVMRWGPKFDDRTRWLTQNGHAIAESLGDSPLIDDISKRLSDVQLAQQVLTDHPDQYWAYRKWLRKRLQDRPRVRVVEGVNGLKNGLHPEDSRRKAYLLALGQTATRGASRADLDSLLEYAIPFDPMVTPFVAREVAALEQRTSELDPAAAWHALSRSVYFTPATDGSVRNVCEAMAVATRYPQVFAQPADQWDQLSGLLETLKQRWSFRIQANANMRFGIADAEASLRMIDDVIDSMESLREAAGVTSDEWQARKTLIDRQLTRPVRSWRSNQAVRLAAQGLAIPTEPPHNEVENADAEVAAPPATPPQTLTPAQTAAQPLAP
jgi:hypothetical protein